MCYEYGPTRGAAALFSMTHVRVYSAFRAFVVLNQEDVVVYCVTVPIK